MLKRKLSALDYHSAEKFDHSKQQEYRSLVIWLEDQKIRHFKIDDRAGLRDISNSGWPVSFQQYLASMACPVMGETPVEILDWLVGQAVKLEHADNAGEYKKYTAEFVSQSRATQPKLVSNNPLDNIDFNAPEFKAGVESLADYMKVTKHPDHLITLQAICKLVSTRFNSKAIQNPELVAPEGQAFPFRESDLGFDTGEYVLNDAAKILRLLYIQDLRTLQTKINESIVCVQAVTGNPKTDTRLGKVGVIGK